MVPIVEKMAKMKKFLLFGIVINLLIFAYIYNQPVSNLITSSVLQVPGEVKFLINTPGCHILDSDPFSPLTQSYFSKSEEVVCSDISPLMESNQTSIWINETVREIKSWKDLKCCHRSLKRGDPRSGGKTDHKVVFGEKCRSFKSSADIFDEFIEVECKEGKKSVYKDYHAFIVRKRPENVLPRQDFEKPSILVIGIDSVSRMNLYRQMPKTVKFMKQIDAIELLGLNKVGDNTFPNVIPLFTGDSVDELKKTCWPNKEDYFDNCTFIWDNATAKGYLTAFGEDTCWMGLFLYLTSGFQKQPTDYYTQPYMKQNEGEIGWKKEGNAKLCSGPRLALDVLMNYANKFVLNMTKENLPFWGHFWGTSLSHDYVNMHENADNIYESLFKSFYNNDVMKNTFIIFMSDHGIRWGAFRSTHQGFMEERLPFAFLMVPRWIQKSFPNAMENLRLNTRRLTTHFDLYATMMDLLDLDNLKMAQKDSFARGSKGVGISLFRPIPLERTCNSSGVPEHFCACHLSKEVPSTNYKVSIAAVRVVEHLNEMLQDYFHLCAPLSLEKIISSREGEVADHKREEFLVTIGTRPGGGRFEATVVYDLEKKKSQVNGYISRVNAYANDSYCINEENQKILKLYCFCNTLIKPES